MLLRHEEARRDRIKQTKKCWATRQDEQKGKNMEKNVNMNTIANTIERNIDANTNPHCIRINELVKSVVEDLETYEQDAESIERIDEAFGAIIHEATRMGIEAALTYRAKAQK